MTDDDKRAMFGTWKYNSETNDVENLRRAYDPISYRSSSHQACNRCHEKKLKCSGEKDGCERCIVNQLACEYTRSGSRTSQPSRSRGKKSSRHASGSDDGPSSHAPSKSSHGRHRTPASGSGSAPSSHHTSGGASSYALNNVEDYFGPEDAFPFHAISAPPTTSMGYSTTTTTAGFPAVSSYPGWTTSQGYAVPSTGADMAAMYGMSGDYTDQEYDYEDYSSYQHPDPRWR